MSAAFTAPIAAPAERITLTAAQAQALEDMREFAAGYVHGPGLFTLEGYAGVGKSTVVAELLQHLPNHMEVAIAAPTHKAVGVLQAKIGNTLGQRVTFVTLHSLLGLRVVEHQDGSTSCRRDGPSNVNQYDLIVVDEASMVGRDLFAKIVQEQHSGRTLFVGDPAQLPPVEKDGATLQLSPVFTRVQRRATLTQIVRQQEGNPIIALSLWVRQAIESGQRITTEELLAQVPEDARNLCTAPGGTMTAVNWALADLREGRDSRLIAYRNATVVAVNRHIHSELYGPNAPAFVPGETALVAEGGSFGPRGQQTKLINGEELTVSSVRPAVHPEYPDFATLEITMTGTDGDSRTVLVPADEAARKRHEDALWAKYRTLKAAAQAGGTLAREEANEASRAAWAFKKAFAPLRHVYASTAHKAQGSTMPTALIDLGDMARMADPGEHARALYVAITRASENLGLICP